jgi:GNAT superfamily N-acetyltransferase
MLARVHESGGYPTNWPSDPALWLTPRDLIEVWVAGVAGEAIAGHMVLTKAQVASRGQPTAEVGRLFVDPAVRRLGVARALIRHAQNWAVENKTDLNLWVADHLRAARELYERSGFELTETSVANWTTPDGRPVLVHRYDWDNPSAGGRGTQRNL